MTDHLSHVCGVILAGGSGARFWPLSREMNPKQLLSVFGTEPLISEALANLRPFLPSGTPVCIVTNARLATALRDLLDDLETPIDYLIEPAGRNTAPAIALAAAVAARRDPEAILLVLPSDHLLERGEVWEATIQTAIRLAGDGYFATIGLQPTRPETGYGYIEAQDEMHPGMPNGSPPRRVVRLVEKPDAARAQQFVDSGRFLWNAGIFCLRANMLLDEMQRLGGDTAIIADTCRWMAEQPAAQWSADAVVERFAALPSISFDHAVLERTRRLAVVPARLSWNDVGSLGALRDLHQADDAGNVRLARGVDLDTRNTVVYSADRLIATLGVEDLMVIDTSDATLICRQDRGQDVRAVVEALRAIGAEEIIEPRTVHRAWGGWTTLVKGEGFLIKLVEIHPGAVSRPHRHARRSELCVVLAGTAEVTLEQVQLTVAPHENVLIPPGVAHRLHNAGDELLKVLEVQHGDEISDDDIERLDDTTTRSNAWPHAH